jgi:uncharacterized membrane protein YkvA (DUF1232 family)
LGQADLIRAREPPNVSAIWIALVLLLAVLCILLGVAAWSASGGWRRSGHEERALVKRVIGLPIRRKLRLALALAREPRVPLLVRAIPPALVLYLVTPIDLIPDFIPVLGHLDDVLILIAGVGLVLRFTPRHVLEEHVTRLEAAARGSL